MMRTEISTSGLSSLESETTLDEGQKFAFDAFLEGHSIAVIGGAGSGKSFFLNKLIGQARLMHGGFPFVAPCAHSNKAAEALDGMTIHRLFAAKPSWEFNTEYLMNNIKSDSALCRRLRKIEVLIIDEISLLTTNVLDSIDFVLRELAQSEWHSSLPLGGRQLIVAFDPFQLEPHPEHGYIQREVLHNSYQSRLWYLTFGPPGDGVVVLLGSNHRQSKDQLFFDMLNRIRVGKQTPEDIRALNKTSERSNSPPNSYTRFCLTNRQVAKINDERLDNLPGPTFKSTASDKYYANGVFGTETLKKRLNGVAQKEVKFKVGAHVILTRKIDDLLPGTQANVRKVVRISSRSECVQYELELETLHEDTNAPGKQGLKARFFKVRPEHFDIHSFDCKVVASRVQLPLIPAYALTIHRSQGMTLTNVAIHFEVANNWKPNGMVYVALSRCRTQSGLWVKSLRSDFITVSGRAHAFMKELQKLHKHMPSRLWGAKYLSPFEENISPIIEACRPLNIVCDTASKRREEDKITSTPSLCRASGVEVDDNTVRSGPIRHGQKNANKVSLISKRRFRYRTVLNVSSRVPGKLRDIYHYQALKNILSNVAIVVKNR